MPPQSRTNVDRLIEEHSDRAYAAAYRLTGNQTDAQDLVQEAFLRALEKAGRYDPAFDFGGWLHRLLYRVYLNRRRGQGRRREVPLEAADAGEWRASPEESPESAALRGETQARIAQGLARLPEDLRACVVLVDVEGRSYEEAADILDWPVGSVAGRLFRARRLLRGWLKEQPGEQP
ncbi:MAG: RNA polymerase sigma factor [Elusimicrobia bacterium]|nr:RNA polymerase sigma factor [Elusimicrobiota bacterium]